MTGWRRMESGRPAAFIRFSTATLMPARSAGQRIRGLTAAVQSATCNGTDGAWITGNVAARRLTVV
jgi:hypothetical protein